MSSLEPSQPEQGQPSSEEREWQQIVELGDKLWKAMYRTPTDPKLHEVVRQQVASLPADFEDWQPCPGPSMVDVAEFMTHVIREISPSRRSVEWNQSHLAHKAYTHRPDLRISMCNDIMPVPSFVISTPYPDPPTFRSADPQVQESSLAWSDVMFCLWYYKILQLPAPATEYTEKVPHPFMIMIPFISSEDDHDRIERALQCSNELWDFQYRIEWPARKIIFPGHLGASLETWKALLTVRPVRNVVELLVEHKKQFGPRVVIDAIDVWKPEEDQGPCLMLVLKDKDDLTTGSSKVGTDPELD